jgi:hypothetical protein
MVPLTTAATPFAARVLAAHLGAEGIVWELRGSVDGPYPLGPVEVLVAEIVTEHGAGGDAPVERAGRGPARSARGLWVVLALVLLTAAVLLGRLLALTWQ